MMNVLAYADNIILLAPSWTAMQTLLGVLDINIHLINSTCNRSTSKTVYMVFNPVCRQKVVCDKFPAFLLSVSICNLLINLNIWVTLFTMTILTIVTLCVKYVICIRKYIF